MLSRSGQSIEVVLLLDKLRRKEARIVAITNTPDSPLARGVDTVVHLGAAFDHNVSFTMYSGLGLAGGLIAAQTSGKALGPLAESLLAGLDDARRRIPSWQQAIAQSVWTQDTSATYFLGRGASVASCHEARLLWEEAAKAPASALPTGGFRHGSQEFVRPGVRLGLWLDPTVLNAEDRGLVADFQTEGALVMCIGAKLQNMKPDLALEVGDMPPGWQFLVDILPAQLASEHVTRAKGEDPDRFHFCSFVMRKQAYAVPPPASVRPKEPAVSLYPGRGANADRHALLTDISVRADRSRPRNWRLTGNSGQRFAAPQLRAVSSNVVDDSISTGSRRRFAEPKLPPSLHQYIPAFGNRTIAAGRRPAGNVRGVSEALARQSG